MTRWHKTWRFHPWWGGTHLFFVGLFHFDNIDSMEEEKKEIILRFASLKFQLQGVFTKRGILVSSKFCVLKILETIHSTFKSISECFYFICIPIKLNTEENHKKNSKENSTFFLRHPVFNGDPPVKNNIFGVFWWLLVFQPDFKCIDNLPVSLWVSLFWNVLTILTYIFDKLSQRLG